MTPYYQGLPARDDLVFPVFEYWRWRNDNCVIGGDGRIFMIDQGKLFVFRQLDFDVDGILDSLETEESPFAVDVDDSRIDSDGDLWMNAEEFLMGTGPLNPESRPSFVLETDEDGTSTNRWPSRADRIYQVEFSEDLEQWFALAFDLAGSEGEMSVTDPEPSARRFYRVRAFYKW